MERDAKPVDRQLQQRPGHRRPRHLPCILVRQERHSTPALRPSPATGEELQERLQATLTPVEARKISVCVIDVSPPADPMSNPP